MSKTSAPPSVLSIAGSDPSGGAGIQADLKTFAMHNVLPILECLPKVYGMSVITALTSQNTTGVTDIHYVPAEFVRKQIEDVIEDIPPNCIKTGRAENDSINFRHAREYRDHLRCCRGIGEIWHSLCCRSCF